MASSAYLSAFLLLLGVSNLLLICSSTFRFIAFVFGRCSAQYFGSSDKNDELCVVATYSTMGNVTSTTLAESSASYFTLSKSTL